MFANPTQLPTSLVADPDHALGTLFLKASASSETLQAEFILVLACKAQSSTVFRIARNWEHHEKQARRSKSKRC